MKGLIYKCNEISPVNNHILEFTSLASRVGELWGWLEHFTYLSSLKNSGLVRERSYMYVDITM